MRELRSEPADVDLAGPYRDELPRLLRLAAFLLADPRLAEDVCQDVVATLLARSISSPDRSADSEAIHDRRCRKLGQHRCEGGYRYTLDRWSMSRARMTVARSWISRMIRQSPTRWRQSPASVPVSALPRERGPSTWPSSVR